MNYVYLRMDLKEKILKIRQLRIQRDIFKKLDDMAKFYSKYKDDFTHR